MKKIYLICILLLSVCSIYGQSSCCVNGVCQPGEKYPNCPDCPCYNAMDSTGKAKPFFYSPYGPFLNKTTVEQQGMCYTINASDLPGTFCFTFIEPGPSQKMELYITPQGCGASNSTVSEMISSSGGGSCSTANNTTNNNGFIISNWKTYDDSCHFMANGIKVGTAGTCNHITGHLYVACVDISAPGACTGVEICPVVNCYNGVCSLPPNCKITAETAATITCSNTTDGTATVSLCDTTSGYTFLWDDAAAQTTATASGLSGGTYHVKVHSPFGCDSTFAVTVPDSTCIYPIKIPNVITPNGDKDNQFFYIENLEYYPNSHLVIYDRWGLKIYENTNYLNDWDGKNYKNNTPVSDGVYYYILYQTDVDNTNYTGFVQVIRG